MFLIWVFDHFTCNCWKTTFFLSLRYHSLRFSSGFSIILPVIVERCIFPSSSVSFALFLIWVLDNFTCTCGKIASFLWLLVFLLCFSSGFSMSLPVLVERCHFSFGFGIFLSVSQVACLFHFRNSCGSCCFLVKIWSFASICDIGTIFAYGCFFLNKIGHDFRSLCRESHLCWWFSAPVIRIGFAAIWILVYEC